MIIAFDTWVLRPHHRNSGIYNYAKNLLREFRNLANEFCGIIVCPFFDKEYSDDALNLGTSANIKTYDTRLLRFHRLWQMGGLTMAAVRAHADIIFSPTHRTCPFGSIPVITTIHDATPILSPFYGSLANFMEKTRLRNAVKLSVQCTTNSESSKKDLVKVFGVSPEKIRVIYHGYDRNTFNLSPADPGKQSVLFERYGITVPYIFHHGTVQPRKNLDRLIRACQILWAKGTDWRHQVVLAGPLGWDYGPVQEAAQNAGPGRVVFTGALPDEDLALLLKGAALCVVPSLYEGFCVPMVEAMASGVPTVVSNSSCFHEVSGGVLKYFDPKSVEEMAETIRHALEDNSLRDRLRLAGADRAAEFSWERCARETLKFIAQTFANYG